MIFFKLRQWWRRVRHPPIVEISHSGQLTAHPQVHVVACGTNGSQTVYSYYADRKGEASATSAGQGLAQILQRRLVDKRQNTELFVHCFENAALLVPDDQDRAAAEQDSAPLRQLGDEE